MAEQRSSLRRSLRGDHCGMTSRITAFSPPMRISDVSPSTMTAVRECFSSIVRFLWSAGCCCCCRRRWHNDDANYVSDRSLITSRPKGPIGPDGFMFRPSNVIAVILIEDTPVPYDALHTNLPPEQRFSFPMFAHDRSNDADVAVLEHRTA